MRKIQSAFALSSLKGQSLFCNSFIMSAADKEQIFVSVIDTCFVFNAVKGGWTDLLCQEIKHPVYKQCPLSLSETKQFVFVLGLNAGNKIKNSSLALKNTTNCQDNVKGTSNV